MDEIQEPDDTTVTPEDGVKDGGEESKLTPEQIASLNETVKKQTEEIESLKHNNEMQKMHIDMMRNTEPAKPVEPKDDRNFMELALEDEDAATQKIVRDALKKSGLSVERLVQMDQVDKRRTEIEKQEMEAKKYIKEKLGLNPDEEIRNYTPDIFSQWEQKGPKAHVLDAYLRAKLQKGELRVSKVKQEHSVMGGSAAFGEGAPPDAATNAIFNNLLADEESSTIKNPSDLAKRVQERMRRKGKIY